MSGYQRLQTLKALGADVVALDTGSFRRSYGIADRLGPRVLGLPDWPSVILAWNQAVLSLGDQEEPRLAWFEWPRYIKIPTLLKLREAWRRTTFVCFQDDNPFGTRPEKRLWKLFKAAIPYWDVHLVKRASDVVNFSRAGGRDVRLFRSGYFEPLFEIDQPPAPRDGTVFVGTALDDRVPIIEELILSRGMDVRIFGRGGKWERTRLAKYRPDLLGPQLFGNDYVKAIRDHRICLGFVSRSNLDEYTMRTFEIPAAGGFLLAQRTAAHTSFFKEGVEAEFFSSVGECAKKIEYYLGHEEERRRVARQGTLRCRRSGYGLRSSMRSALIELLD